MLTYLSSCINELLFDISGKDLMMVLDINPFNSVLKLSFFALVFYFIQNIFGLCCQICKLLRKIIESLVLLLDFIQEYLVVMLGHKDRFQLLDMLFLGILNAQMIFHFIVHQSDLFENLENHFGDIIILFDNIESLVLLLSSILPLSSFHFKHIKRHFAHFNGVEFGRVWISSLADETVFISRIIILALSQFIWMLVKLAVFVVKINTGYIDFIHILKMWISGSYTNISLGS